MNSYLVNTFIELAEIDAASGKERGIADRLKAELAALGCTTVIEDDTGKITGGDAGSVYAVFRASCRGGSCFAVIWTVWKTGWASGRKCGTA
jgi:tripeptide aminopeptidase